MLLLGHILPSSSLCLLYLFIITLRTLRADGTAEKEHLELTWPYLTCKNKHVYMYVHACMLVCVHTLEFSLVFLVSLPSHSCLLDIQKEVGINNSLETSEHEFMNRISFAVLFCQSLVLHFTCHP